MAILDKENILSLAQAVTSSSTPTPSSNVIDFGVAGSGKDKKILISVAEAAASGGSATVTFAIQTDDNNAFSSATTLFSNGPVAKATLTAGYLAAEYVLPSTVERFVRVLYTVGTADLTAGKFNAYLDSAQQTNMVV